MNYLILFICNIIILFSLSLKAEPEAPVRLCAEWEPAIGTLIRWPLGIPLELVFNLAQDDSLFVLVANEAEENSARNTFIYHGINLQNCRFIQTATNSHWTRDWGPHSIFYGDNTWGIVDPQFDGYPWVPGYRDYDDDDQINQLLGEIFDCEVFEMPAYFTGGNIMTDGHNTAFSTQQMLAENLQLGYNQSEFLSLIEAYTGISDYWLLPNIEDYGIQHIDCGAKLLDEETVLIKRLPDWHPEFQRLEDLTQSFASITNCFDRDYQIIRIDCPAYNGSDCAAYTNSFILNHKVLVPMFGIPADSQALTTYQQAMPGYNIVGIYHDNWYYYDALHCRTREIIDKNMLYMQHRPLDNIQPAGQEIDIFCNILPCSGAELNTSHLFLMWRQSGSSQFNVQNLVQTAQADSFTATFPDLEPSTTFEYYLTAEDFSGRIQQLPRTAPQNLYYFTTDNSTPAAEDLFYPLADLQIFPNPFNPQTSISFSLKHDCSIKISIHNLKGQLIKDLVSQHFPAGYHSIPFHLHSPILPSGIYFILIKADHKFISQKKCLLLK